jgi:exodeoxyribonuclease X
MLTEAMGAIKRYDAILTVLARMKPDTIVVAHNADFDCKFIPEITRPWLCTYRAAKHVWPGAPGYSNQVLRYWLKLDVVVPEGKYPHQALYDATVTTGLLLKMLERYTPEQLLQMSKLPVRLKNIGFGKHRGTAFENIPIDYLRWLRGQSNLDPDLKHTLDSILK